MDEAEPWGDAGDVTYPHFLINGRPPADPETLRAKAGQKFVCESSMPPPTPSSPLLSGGTG